MEGKLLTGNIGDGEKLQLNKQDSCCRQARVIRYTRRMKEGTEFDQILRVIRNQGWGFSLK